MIEQRDTNGDDKMTPPTFDVDRDGTLNEEEFVRAGR